MSVDQAAPDQQLNQHTFQRHLNWPALMPQVALQTDKNRLRRAVVKAVCVVACCLWLVSIVRKHNAVVDESGLDCVEHALSRVKGLEAAPIVPSRISPLDIADLNLQATVAKRSDSDDTDPESEDEESDGDGDGNEDQGDEGDDGGDPNETLPKQVARGCQLVEMMKTPDDELEAKHRTPWHSYKQLSDYGWDHSDQDPTGDLGSHPNLDEQKDSVNSALDALGIPRIPSRPNDASGGWQKVAWIHNRETKVNGRTYPVTRAYIINYYNPGFGIIIAANTKSAAKMSPHLPRDQLVPLGQWSDITALTSGPTYASSTHRTPIRSNILPQVIDKDLDELGSYKDAVTVPGMPDSDKARAAIGFPNGRGVGYLLVQHKDIFGDTRTIRSIKVWNSNNGVHEKMSFFNEVPNMLYTFS